MRYFWLTLACVLAGQAVGAAQQPPTQTPPAQAAPVLDPANNRLDLHLLNWEREMRKIQTLVAQCTRVDENRTFGHTDVFQGTAKYMKVAEGNRMLNLASLEMVNKKRPDVYEKFLCTGTLLYQFVPKEKEIRAHALPTPPPGQVAEDNFLSFLFGMRAEEAKRRYDLKLAPGKDEDKYYVYVDILPRFNQDKVEFERARLVLNKDSYMPRQLWFKQPSGDTVTWDLPRVENGVPLNRREFETPQAPPGWKVRQMPQANEAPRIYRHNQ